MKKDKFYPVTELEMTRTKETGVNIIISAKYLFATKGYHNTSIRDIAILSGVSSSMIHYYYSSKENLLYGVISSISKEKTNTQVYDSAWDHLSHFINSTIDYMYENDNSLKIIFQESLIMISEKIKNMIHEIMISFRQTFLRIIESGIENGDFRRTDDADNLYYLVVGTLKHHFDYHYLSGNGLSDKDLMQKIKAYLLDVLRTALEK